MSTSDYTRFQKFILFILESECAYAKGSRRRIPEDVVWENVPGDNGGVTKYGVDQRSHPGVDIKNLSLDAAEGIYYKEWLGHRCDELTSPIAECVFDAFVTGGRPIQWLQQVLGVQADGYIGPKTLAAAKASKPLETAQGILVMRDAYFKGLANSQAHDRQFLDGWLARDTDLKKLIPTLV